jgi:electron transfer flavoprotein alpha subunit
LSSAYNALVYSDIPDNALELIGLCNKIGIANLSVAVLGSGDLQNEVSKLSVSKVSSICKVSDDALNGAFGDPVVGALEAIYETIKPSVIIIGATRRGREIAPRLATRLEIGCITDALSIELSENKLIAERLVWGGNALARVSSNFPVVVTIPIHSNEKATENTTPKFIELKPNVMPSRVKLLGKKERPLGQVSIKEADVVVSAGRGFKKKEDLALLDGLVSTLNGVMGASRPLTSDLGWVPEDRQVGLSGTTVKPKLYVAIGISGQIQHLTGMRDSKVVVAINNDKNAPIFQESDYGVVGDLYFVVPELEKALKTRLNS